MSCSQFIEHDDEDKSDTLVVIVNGDGTVSVDRETLERVLQQQCRAAVSFIKLEDSNEPDSQSGKVSVEENDALSDDKDALCNKVNLVVEGYYPPPPLNMASKNNGSADSVVSSTVATPPLPQSSSEFLDLLSEGLEIPVSNVQTSSNEGCIGDSLVDAFSEMAPEQLKQVETALHSEKAKQILGDDVTSVLDTLKLKEEDDWVHFDHCYTNIYGNKKSSPTSNKVENVVVQHSEEATYVTIKVGENETGSEKNDASSPKNVCETPPQETCEESTFKNKAPDSQEEPIKLKRRSIQSSTSAIEKSDEKAVVPKRNISDSQKNSINSARDKRSLHLHPKVKRKNTSKSDLVEQPVERVVTEDEVDGVKVFKPTRSDKKSARPFIFSREGAKNILPRSQLIQTKLNFVKKENNNESIASTGPIKPSVIYKEKAESHISRPDASLQKNRSSSVNENDESSKNVKKETPRKQPPAVTPETFGPALFSTPDIIRKINNDDASKDGDKSTTPCESSLVPIDETADIEKRMSAIENGEAILDRIHMQFEMENKQRYSSQSDDDRLLSDLENTDDESNQMESNISAINVTKKSDSSNSNSNVSSRKSSNVDKSENSDKEDIDYEDDPNKLWCICNKPHGNRFMICCDACDNWYHGSCVGVTRPMGEKMEMNGTEWLCPSCRKEKSAKEREVKLKLPTRSITNRATGKQNMSNSLNSPSSDTSLTASTNSCERPSSQTSTVRRKSSSQPLKILQSQLCIECKEKEIMPNALYCSKVCIERQVDTFVKINSTPSDPLPDEQKIIVVDKKRDHRITGMRAPSVAHLKEWLMEHPSYEIVRPSAFPMSRPLPATKQPSKPIQKPTEPAKPSPLISKDPQNAAVKTKISLKFKDNSVSSEGSSQTSIRYFFGSKFADDVNSPKVKKIEDGSGNILIREGNVLRTVSSATSKKEPELKMKEKQRVVKLIPSLSHTREGEEQKPVQQILKKVVMPATASCVEKEKKRKTDTAGKEKPPVPKKAEVKRQDSKKSLEEAGDANDQASLTTKPAEPIRPKLKKSLSDLFVSRSKDITDLTVAESELIALATQVEEELFNFFKDTGQKYKNKYRSLVFNLRDQKNNLFRRVADRSLTPYELVRMTPEELASTELAQWREREAKHEIDMIKKTELENLSQSKVLVVKTHKGELEIEPDSLPPSKATDIVVPDLQPDDFPVEKERGKTYTSALSKDRREKHGSGSNIGTSSVTIKDKDASSSKEDGDKKDRHKKSDHRDRGDRHKSRKHRHRSSERDHHRSRSRRSRSKSGEKDNNGGSGHKSSTVEKSGHRSRSSDKGHGGGSRSSGVTKDRHRSRSKRKRSHSRNRRKHRSGERKYGTVGAANTTCSTSNGSATALTEEGVLATANEKKVEPLSVGSGERFSTAVGDVVVEMEKPTEDEQKIAADLLSSYNAVDVDLSDMEPTSTVTINTPPYGHSPDGPVPHVWKGVVSMPEVAKFHACMKEVSGNCDGLDEDLPTLLNCVGRIRFEVMWRYISVVKKSGHEIAVLRFEVEDDSQQLNYLSLYSYLSTKNRMGVINPPSASIKDFYVMPLASHSPIPQVLLPLDGPGFEDNRSHMLLGVIVRTRRKKYLPHSSSATNNRKSELESGTPVLPPLIAPVVESDSFTPPHSPTSVFVNNSVSVPSTMGPDEDEPYSPGDDDEEPYSPSALDDDHSNKSLDLEREMEEINRKIAEEKQKIKQIEMGSSLPIDSEKESNDRYSPAAEAFPSEVETPSVQLPDDLQRLLNSFSKRSESTAPLSSSSTILQADPIVSAYKSHKDVEDAGAEPSFSSPEVSDRCTSTAGSAASNIALVAAAAATAEPAAEEMKVSRDPRRKMLVTTDTSYATSSPVNQPPPPGLEDEFSHSSGGPGRPSTMVATAGTAVATTNASSVVSGNESAAMISMATPDPAFGVSMPATVPFYAAAVAVASGVGTTVPQYPPPMMASHAPMYMTGGPVFPQPGTLPPYGTIPAAQMYVPPAVLHHDPSMIPLPVDGGDKSGSSLLKRKAIDDIDDDDSEKGGSRKSDAKAKKMPAYYSTDAKSRRSHSRSRSPSRHKSSGGYESHRRGYQRDDGEYSRYSHKHGKGYSSRRSSYWKGGNDYSSGHRKYSDRNRRSRSSSREKSSRRYDNNTPKTS